MSSARSRGRPTGPVIGPVIGIVIDVVAVGVTFGVLGALGALLWQHQADLPRYTHTAAGTGLDEIQLAKVVTIDGWYAVIALAGGLVAGILLTWLRGRRPLLMVVLLVGGGVLGAWVMLRLGYHLGPSDPTATLDHLPLGGHALAPLKPQAPGVEFAWPMAALLGAAAVLLGGQDRPSKRLDSSDETGVRG